MFLVLLGSRDTVFFVVHSDQTGICFVAAKELCFCQAGFSWFWQILVIFPNYKVMTHLAASPGLKLAQQIGFVKLKTAGKDEWSFIVTILVIGGATET